MNFFSSISASIKDGVITFLWVFCVSTVGAITSFIVNEFDINHMNFIPHVINHDLVITTTLIFILLLIFNLLCDAIGGASFNPTATASFYAVGLGDDTLLSMAIRFPVQAAGAMFGALAITDYMPVRYKHTLKGPSLLVDAHMGAAVEGILTFVITLIVLWIIIKGPKSSVVKTWMMSVSTVALVLVGAQYTGPSMNPANAYGWAYLDNRHNTWEQFYVYWISPFVGAILAGWFFRVLFPQKRTEKAKKA